ncbi:MAG: energy-coupling factor transporter ATPase [Erysipelotrichaceae bacterium]|nr:energy-coupling factor transporter ATPase [Erysipelotrichaceae bacterium]
MDKIVVKNLTYSYTANSKAVDDLSLQIEQGSFTSIIGHNGSGKSTLAKLIVGLLKANNGQIFVDDVLLDEISVNEIRKKIAIVFQNPDNQFIGSTVEDDIAFGLENRQIPSKDMPDIIKKYAEYVKMEDYLKKEPTFLSGGQKQRVAIAGALALKPEILILDEATAMIDAKGKREIFLTIKHMRKDNPDLTIISITHEVEEALLSDRVIVMDGGKAVYSGSPMEVFSNKEVREKYKLQAPFLISLKEELKENGFDVDDLNDIKEVTKFLCQ